MENMVTLKDALRRIADLENENAALREELEYYKNRKMSGRLSFILCSTISVGITRLAENAENRKLEQALKKIKED